MRHLHGFGGVEEEDSTVVENSSLKPRKTTSTIWHSGTVGALLLFYRQIMTRTRSYDWLKGVSPLALGWYKFTTIRSSLKPSNSGLGMTTKDQTDLTNFQLVMTTGIAPHQIGASTSASNLRHRRWISWSSELQQIKPRLSPMILGLHSPLCLLPFSQAGLSYK